MKNKKLLSNVYGSIENNDLFIDESDFFLYDPEEDDYEEEDDWGIFVDEDYSNN